MPLSIERSKQGATCNRLDYLSISESLRAPMPGFGFLPTLGFTGTLQLGQFKGFFGQVLYVEHHVWVIRPDV